MSDDLVEIARGSHSGDTYMDATMTEPRLLIHVMADEITRLRAELATARREGMEGFDDLVAAIRAAAKEGKP